MTRANPSRADPVRRSMLAAAGAGLGLILCPAALRGEAGAYPPLGETRYRVLRRGAEIGRHVARFRRAGDAFEAVNEMDIEAKLLGIPVYRYAHRSRELWRGGRLRAVESRTDKNGEVKELAGDWRDGALRISYNGAPKRRLDGRILTTSLWHPETPSQPELLDIEDADLKRPLEGPLVGREAVPVAGGGTVEARHYAIRGDFERDVWYDGKGRLVRVEFNAGPGDSRIVLEPTALAG